MNPRPPAARPRRTTSASAPAPAAVPAVIAWIRPRVRERLHAYALLTRQDRPVGWLLLLWPTWWGLWLAARGLPPLGTLVVFTLGVLLMRSAGCVINDYADRHLDPKVERTRTRPIASGLVSPREALIVFAVLIALAFALVLTQNPRTVMLSGVAAALAVVYPFMKRWTWWPQLWLGAAFGMAVPMAHTAVTGAWPDALAWLVFVANVLWSTAYDTLYAMVDREDDLRAGAKSTAILFGDLDLVAVGVLQACFLAAMALAGQRAGLGLVYALGWLIALILVAVQLYGARSRSREDCFAAFRQNALVGGVLWLAMAADLATR